MAPEKNTSSEVSTPRTVEITQRAIPVLPVRDNVLFPHAVLPLPIGRESSVQLINSLGDDKTILVVAQREAHIETPQPEDLYTIGTVATVHKVAKVPTRMLAFTEGLSRARLKDFTQLIPFFRGEVEIIEEKEPETSPELEALQHNVLTLFQQIAAELPRSDQLQAVAAGIKEPGHLVNFIASILPFFSTSGKQEILETSDVYDRLLAIKKHLARELGV